MSVVVSYASFFWRPEAYVPSKTYILVRTVATPDAPPTRVLGIALMLAHVSVNVAYFHCRAVVGGAPEAEPSSWYTNVS